MHGSITELKRREKRLKGNKQIRMLRKTGWLKDGKNPRLDILVMTWWF
jgi:hypothetical protein